MRLLRALAHLVLVFAVMTAASVQARPMGVMPPLPAVSEHQGHHPVVGHAAHDPGDPATDPPAHKRDGCQTACCFTPGQVLAPLAAAATAAFFCPVRYGVAAEPATGRADTPDPGIPKHAA